MTVPRPTPGPDVIHDELARLRRGDALAHPGVVRTLRPELQRLLLVSQGSLTGRADEVPRMVDAIRRAIDTLGPRERLIAQTEFHLLAEHSHPTLSQRQESLAAALGCTVRTVRRGGKLALDTLIMRISTGTYPSPSQNVPIAAAGTDEQARRHQDLAAFWGIHDSSRIDVVCSELPPDLRAATGPAGTSQFMRYGQFADLDALFYTRIRLARSFPAATVHDFAPGEHYDADADTLIVIGHPTWNSKHHEFLADLTPALRHRTRDRAPARHRRPGLPTRRRTQPGSDPAAGHEQGRRRLRRHHQTHRRCHHRVPARRLPLPSRDLRNG